MAEAELQAKIVKRTRLLETNRTEPQTSKWRLVVVVQVFEKLHGLEVVYARWAWIA